jgi:hypothetical protein
VAGLLAARFPYPDFGVVARSTSAGRAFFVRVTGDRPGSQNVTSGWIDVAKMSCAPFVRGLVGKSKCNIDASKTDAITLPPAKRRRSE